MVTCQEELKMLRLQYGMMFESAIEMRERQLSQKLEHKKDMKVRESRSQTRRPIVTK